MSNFYIPLATCKADNELTNRLKSVKTSATSQILPVVKKHDKTIVTLLNNKNGIMGNLRQSYPHDRYTYLQTDIQERLDKYTNDLMTNKNKKLNQLIDSQYQATLDSWLP